MQRFAFFFDDAVAAADGTGADAPAANDAAAALLQASAEWCPGAEVRCCWTLDSGLQCRRF